MFTGHYFTCCIQKLKSFLCNKDSVGPLNSCLTQLPVIVALHAGVLLFFFISVNVNLPVSHVRTRNWKRVDFHSHSVLRSINFNLALFNFTEMSALLV